MPSQVTNYQCPSCTGPLHFVGSTGKLECDYCGSSYDVAEIEALYASKEEQAVQAQREAEAKEEQAGSDWDFSGLNSDWGADAEKMKSYTCTSCGAQLICDVSTAATSCPYCGNPTIVPGQLSGALKPDFVIPFKLSKEDAVAALKQHYKGKFFLPKYFVSENHVQQIQGVYVPFWLFDGQAQGEARYETTRSRIYRTGDYEVTETDHFSVLRAGWLSFEKVPVDASSKMPDDHMDSIEPYDYSELKPFSTAYLPGYLADKYDVSAGECAPRIDQRCRQTTAELLRRDVTGFMTVSLRSMDAKITHENVHYALLPVWLLHTSWKGKNYLYAMNGQTGKFVGELPTSGGRFWGLTAALTVALTGLTTLVGFWSWLLNLIGGFFG